MQNAPPPTDEQLERVRDAIGAASLSHARRLKGGLSSTIDVLDDGHARLVLRRYGSWSEGRADDIASRETRALELLQRANVPAPAPIWIDSDGVFEEQAILISFVEGSPDLTPSNPFDWAEQLAATLGRIHDIRLEPADAEIFPVGAGEDAQRIQETPEIVLDHPLGEDLLRRRVMLAGRDVETDLVFSHADYWPGNTLWREGSLSAVVDWDSASTGDRAMDVAYCSLDIRYLGMERVADRFIAAYREVSDDAVANLSHWESVGLCRPMPDIGEWVPAWESMGRSLTVAQARERFDDVLADFLQRTA